MEPLRACYANVAPVAGGPALGFYGYAIPDGRLVMVKATSDNSAENAAQAANFGPVCVFRDEAEFMQQYPGARFHWIPTADCVVDSDHG